MKPNILLAGVTGYIGKNLIQSIKDDATLFTMSKYPKEDEFQEVTWLKKDIYNYDNLINLLSSNYNNLNFSINKNILYKSYMLNSSISWKNTFFADSTLLLSHLKGTYYITRNHSTGYI